MTSAPMSVSFSGVTISIQPRIRLTRSFDQRFHTYLGYVLFLRGPLVPDGAFRVDQE